MLHHVEINVSDLTKAREFYESFLPDLGYKLYQEWPEGFSYRMGKAYVVFVQTEEAFLPEGYHRKATGLNHLAFHADSRGHVDALTEKARKMGFRILYEDRHPFAGGPDYYAVFIEAPDRMKFEIVSPE